MRCVVVRDYCGSRQISQLGAKENNLFRLFSVFSHLDFFKRSHVSPSGNIFFHSGWPFLYMLRLLLSCSLESCGEIAVVVFETISRHPFHSSTTVIWPKIQSELKFSFHFIQVFTTLKIVRNCRDAFLPPFKLFRNTSLWLYTISTNQVSLTTNVISFIPQRIFIKRTWIKRRRHPLLCKLVCKLVDCKLSSVEDMGIFNEYFSITLGHVRWNLHKIKEVFEHQNLLF